MYSARRQNIEDTTADETPLIDYSTAGADLKPSRLLDWPLVPQLQFVHPEGQGENHPSGVHNFEIMKICQVYFLYLLLYFIVFQVMVSWCTQDQQPEKRGRQIKKYTRNKVRERDSWIIQFVATTSYSGRSSSLKYIRNRWTFLDIQILPLPFLLCGAVREYKLHNKRWPRDKKKVSRTTSVKADLPPSANGWFDWQSNPIHSEC